jgi:hypothetical protein
VHLIVLLFFWEIVMIVEIVGISERDIPEGIPRITCQPGEVVHVGVDGTTEILSVFEVATDPATAGEKEFAVFECLRRSELLRRQQVG